MLFILLQEILSANVDAKRLLEQGSLFEQWLRGGMASDTRQTSRRGTPGMPAPLHWLCLDLVCVQMNECVCV